MDDFLFLARTQAEAIWQRDYIERHVSGFGLLRNPNKGVWEPTQKLVHLGFSTCLAIAPARFYLCELHDVLKTRDSWSGRVKLSRQLERDLQWWDNQAVVGVLTHLTSRSPGLMAELRKTWDLMDTHGINLSVRYIRSAANIWDDRLSREVDCDD
eukprot:jgi/Tetstr1/461948/TSEL_007026.t1